MDLMTAKVDSADYAVYDVQDSSKLSKKDSINYWGIDDGGFALEYEQAFSAEDILTADSARFIEYLDTLVERFRGHTNYFEVEEECAMGQMYVIKHVAKLLRDRVGDSIQILMFTHDSLDFVQHGYPNQYQFYLEGVRLGWLDSNYFLDPKVLVTDPYPFGYNRPLARRVPASSATDSATVHNWQRRYVPAKWVVADGFLAHPYTPLGYYDSAARVMRDLVRTFKSIKWFQDRNPGLKYGMALQTGAGLVHENGNPDTIFVFGAGLRPPTGAEVKGMAHLSVSMGAAYLTPYTFSNAAGEGGNGGFMNWDGDHSSNMFRFKPKPFAPADLRYQDVWYGFKERFDTIKTLFPVLRKYGDVIVKSDYITDILAFQRSPLLADLFVDSSIRAYDSLGVRDLVDNVDTLNRTDVHVSIWRERASGDTLLYITNLRTDDSYIPGTEICSRENCRFISLQMKRSVVVTDILDTAENRAVGRVRTPYVGVGDSLVVWLTPGEGVLVRLTPPLAEPTKQMKMAINFPKPSTAVTNYFAHGNLQLNKPLPGVKDRFYSDSTRWTVPSSIHSYVAIHDDSSVTLHQDSLLYQSPSSDRPEKWRQQNWRKGVNTIDFGFKNVVGTMPSGLTQRPSQTSVDSIAHSVSIRTDFEGRFSNASVKFWDPFYVRHPSLANETDTLVKSTPFTPHSLQGSVPGAHAQGYGGVFFNQDPNREALKPNYALSAFPGFKAGTWVTFDTMPTWTDWSFLHWYRDDKNYPTTYDWDDYKAKNDAIFGKDGATYIARYKSHMTSYIGGTTASNVLDTGFEGNSQRKLIYLRTDSLRWYQTIWSSIGRIYTAVGSHPLDDSWITWGRDQLLSSWDDTTAAYPALVLHRDYYNGNQSQSAVFQRHYPGDGTWIMYRHDLGREAQEQELTTIINEGPGESAPPKSLAMPALAGIDLQNGELDVVAYAAEDGIHVVAMTKSDPTEISSIISFGNSSALNPTIWADTCLACTGDSTSASEAIIYLAWQQKIYAPGRKPSDLSMDSTTDIYAVRFKAGLNIFGNPVLSLMSDGSSTPFDVSNSVAPSHSNQRPCISGVWRGSDTVIVYIAYEANQEFMIMPGPTFITQKGINVAHCITPHPVWSGQPFLWARTKSFVESLSSENYTRPSIEANRYQLNGTTPVAKDFFYSLAYELSGGGSLIHWAMDKDLARLTSSTFLNTQRPQLAVVYDQVDSNNYRLSHSSYGEPRWLVHQNHHLFKIGTADTLFGYRSVSETDSNDIGIAHLFGELRTDDGAVWHDHEHSYRSGSEVIDSVNPSESIMQSERLVLPANGTLSYYTWIASTDDSLFRAVYDKVQFAMSFYDTTGTFQFDLDTLTIADSMSGIAPCIRNVTLSLADDLTGYVQMRRISPLRGVTYPRTRWNESIQHGRLSSASLKKAKRPRNATGQLATVDVVPNPFAARTLVTFELPEESIVDLEIFNAAGQLIQQLIGRGQYRAGSHGIYWDPAELPNGAWTCPVLLDTCRCCESGVRFV